MNKNKKAKRLFLKEPLCHDIGIIGDFTVKCRGETLNLYNENLFRQLAFPEPDYIINKLCVKSVKTD